MAQRGIREFDGKKMLAKYWSKYFGSDFNYPGKTILVDSDTNMADLPKQHGWLKEEKLVVKPDQLFGKRGKHGLIKANATFDEVKSWIAERMNKETTIGKNTDKLTHFLIEPFVEHKGEFYVAIKSNRAGDTIYFSNHGGVEIEEVWDTVVEIDVAIDADVASSEIEKKLPSDTPEKYKKMFGEFVCGLFNFYKELGYTYLEINPFVVSGDTIVPLDMVARVDDTAHFECAEFWGDLDYPAPFGRMLSKEEEYIKTMDMNSGASLKLTILNPKGRVWTMVAGGGASVIYADTIVDLGHGTELANYGEYSGNPSMDETYEYAKTLMDLMTREKDPQGRGKILDIGGGIANFTDVAKTFKGIIMALKDYQQKLIDTDVRIYVRRGGPNYQEGLDNLKKAADDLGIPIHVFGPDTHMTREAHMALQEA
ncbi:MAG: ATPase [Alphaproteobacteria bacterium]|nr:ATPase [Alphaproteobacteria bacterium]